MTKRRPKLLVSQLTRIAAPLLPERAARKSARDRFGHLKSDANNFGHPDELATLIAPYRMVSFDLFDTLVWREIALEDVQAKTAEFADRFLRGDHGPLPRGLLFHARRRHQEALKKAGMALKAGYRNEIDLEQVFDTALAPYIADPQVRARAVAAALAFEIETEARVLTVDPAMRDFLVKLRAQGKVVILISDMYFSETLLRDILTRLNLLHYFDHIFVSATVGVTKHSGKLFSHVDAALGSGDWKRIHVGDNWNNDVVQPRKAGWDALHYLNTANEMRKHELEVMTRLDGYRQPKARKRLLAEIRGTRPEGRLVRLVAAGFLGFARQVLSTAQRDGFDRVMFLTRDGTVYHHLIRQFLADSGAGDLLDLPRMEELAFSRRMGVLLTCPDSTNPDWEGHLRHVIGWLRGEGASLGSLMRAFGLTREEMEPLRGIDQWADAYLDGREECDIDLGAIIAQPELLAAVDAVVQAKRQRLVDYLEQKTLFGPDQRVLLVDIGYSGTVLKSFSEHIYAREAQGIATGARLEMMMFAASRHFDANLGQMHPRVSMRDPLMVGREDWRHRATALNFAWLEPFAVDRSRGSLQDFRADADGIIQPVFANAALSRNTMEREHLLEAAREVDQVLRRAPLAGEEAEALIARAISDSFSSPCRETLKGVAGLSHHGGLTDVVEGAVLTRIRPLHLRRDISRCLHEDRWVQGSMAASRLGWLNPLLNRIIGVTTR